MSDPQQVLEQHSLDIQALQASQQRNTDLLEQILQRVAVRPISPIIATELPTLTPAIATNSVGPIMPLPNEYNGDRSTGRNFYNSCLLYISMNGTKFQTDKQKILWVVSLMRTGRAALFANRLMKSWSRGGETSSWNEFALLFEREFFPADEAATARVKLEGTGFYQGKRTVDEYTAGSSSTQQDIRTLWQ
jgi:hypothetical protein